MKSVIVVSVAVVFYLSIGSSLAQIISIGQCSSPAVVQDFDVEAYLGLWYEVSRYEQTFQRNGECVTAEYSLNDDGSVRVQNRMLVPPSGQFDEDIGRAVLSFPQEDPLQAKLNVSFGGMRKLIKIVHFKEGCFQQRIVSLQLQSSRTTGCWTPTTPVLPSSGVASPSAITSKEVCIRFGFSFESLHISFLVLHRKLLASVEDCRASDERPGAR